MSTCECCDAVVVDGGVVVESMPEHLRASHMAAGDRGYWPTNGAIRQVFCPSCADEIIACDGSWSQAVPRRFSAVDENGGEAAYFVGDVTQVTADVISHWQQREVDAERSTFWINVTVREVTGGVIPIAPFEVRVAIDPIVPACAAHEDHKHVWRDDVGSGGVRVAEVCRCGWRRITTIDPIVPACAAHEDHKHVWRDDGVIGSGGGVRVAEVCRCGWRRITDTWASDHRGRRFPGVSYSPPVTS